jgi:HAD superfamily hydrolase (TIGR01490 family)
MDMAPRVAPAAAFFDLDRTLISGSSAFTFGITAWRNDLVPTGQFAKDALGAVMFRLSGASDGKTDQTRMRILGAIKGIPQAELVALNASIIPKLLDRIRPEASALIDMHRRAGRDTYIISASPAELVAPLAQSLGMTGGIGTVAEVVDGVYTGELVGAFCYGEGKVEAIKELQRWDGYDLERCYGYSDSASDLPMLDVVGHPVAVNPDAPLEKIAHERGWPVIIFARQRKTVVKASSAAVGGLALAGATFAAGLRVGQSRIGRPRARRLT